MPKRIFIAINLPEEIKNQLVVSQKKWPTLPIRWIKKENIHITLAFLGYLDEAQLLDTLKTVEKVISLHNSFSILLNKIYYGPPEKIPPRMVWVKIEKNSQLLALQNDLIKQLFSLSSFEYKEKEKREYSPHITLGRIKQWEFKKMNLEQRPKINELINLDFEVSSIDVMESQLKREGAKYTILEIFQLSE